MTTVSWADLQKTMEDGTRPMADGTYEVVVEEATATTSSTDKPMINAKMRVTSGAQAGRRLFTNFVLSADNAFALQIFFTRMRAFGCDPAVVAPTGSMDQLAAALVGRTAYAEVGTRQWQGVDRNEVKSIMPSPGIGVPSGMPTAGVPSGVPSVSPASTPPTTPAPPVVSTSAPTADVPSGTVPPPPTPSF